jgi:hypothetical protein
MQAENAHISKQINKIMFVSNVTNLSERKDARWRTYPQSDDVFVIVFVFVLARNLPNSLVNSDMVNFVLGRKWVPNLFWVLFSPCKTNNAIPRWFRCSMGWVTNEMHPSAMLKIFQNTGPGYRSCDILFQTAVGIPGESLGATIRCMMPQV